jgi:hypothetical protein
MEHNIRHITIGLLQCSSAWTSLLDQIGVHWEVIPNASSIFGSEYSVVICNENHVLGKESPLKNYAETGGAVLFIPSSGHALSSRTLKKTYVTSLPPESTPDRYHSEILDLYDDVHFFRNGSYLETEPVGNGLFSFLGIDVEFLLSTSGTLRKSFYAQRDRLPHEIVARRSRAALRQLIQAHLEYLHHRRAMPFVHKWFYPSAHQTLFTFRIDSDKGTQSQIEEIYQMSERFNIPTTWFLDVKSHEQWLQYFSKFNRQEIAVHCYEHRVSRSKAVNRDNFDRALSLLREHGFQPSGIAAPTGAWSDAIGRAIQELGFTYSSEFAYDYDDLPSLPLIGNELSPVVQLPVHPTCIGTMRREQMTVSEMRTYFIDIVQQKIARREPVCLYHHPTHGMNSVFEEVFQYINAAGILKLTYAEYAAWWNRRQKFSVRANVSGSKLSCAALNSSTDTFIRISRTGGDESITKVLPVMDLKDLIRLEPQQGQVIPRDIMRTRERKLRHTIQNVLDWWIKATE